MRERADVDAVTTEFINDVRLHIFRTAIATGRVPQVPEIAQALHGSEAEARAATRQLAEARIIVLAPNDASIWIAAPFCAVPTQFRVETNNHEYYGICIWDALGIIAIAGADHGTVHASCGDCGAPIELEVKAGELTRSEGVVHFGVPARNWWDDIGFT